MNRRSALVQLGDLVVGRLVEDELGRIEFRLDAGYRQVRPRPVLGQWFEDNRRDSQRGDRSGAVPSYFANLIPEGELRSRISRLHGIADHDDLGFLCTVGEDQPGTLIIRAEGDATEPRSEATAPRPTPDKRLRFSLAGVQLEFSLVRTSDRFTLPGPDERGAWIAKVSPTYPDLPANEWVTMEWARHTGFDVPATDLRPWSDLVDLPGEGDPDGKVFLIARYDRTASGGRVHQEDFQQVVGRRPDKKYDDVTYDKVVLLAKAIVGSDVQAEVIRRLAFMAASGNNDAHMKNWSLVYPDGVRAWCAPLFRRTPVWGRSPRSPRSSVRGNRGERGSPGSMCFVTVGGPGFVGSGCWLRAAGCNVSGGDARSRGRRR